MKQITIDAMFTGSVLGSLPNNPDIYASYIASKAPDAGSIADEIESIGQAEVISNGTTVFQRLPGHPDTPCIMDYHIRGMFKEICSALRNMSKKSGKAEQLAEESAKINNFKKVIDSNVFVYPRYIPIELSTPIDYEVRPLRASGPQGERVAIARSERIEAGSTFRFDVVCPDIYVDAVLEWLNYARFKGLGQWRNAGHGTFVYKLIELKDFDMFDSSLDVTYGYEK